MSAMEPTGEIAAPVPFVEAGGLRFVTMRANLMPEEVIVARRVEALRRKIVIALGAFVVIIAVGYALSWMQTRSAKSDLADLNQQNAGLIGQQSQFAKLTKAQSDAASAQSQLATLMTGDIPWNAMLAKLHAQAPTGTQLTGITATIPSAYSGNGSAGSSGSSSTGTNLNQSGQQQVGTIAITGSAATKAAVATFSDRLSAVKGLTAPLITNISTVAEGVSFTMTVTVTTDALGGRFTPTATNQSATAGGSVGVPATTGGK